MSDQLANSLLIPNGRRRVGSRLAPTASSVKKDKLKDDDRMKRSIMNFRMELLWKILDEDPTVDKKPRQTQDNLLSQVYGHIVRQRETIKCLKEKEREAKRMRTAVRVLTILISFCIVFMSLSYSFQ